MSDDQVPPPEPPKPPDLRSVPLPPHPKRNKARLTMGPDDYERLAVSYLTGVRTVRGLAKACGVSQNTAKRAIERGWPRFKWAPLRDRAEVYDRQRAAETAKTANVSPAQADEMGRWVQMRTESMSVGRALRAMAQRLAIKLNQEVDRAVSTRVVQERRYRDVKVGKRVVQRLEVVNVTLPPYLPALAEAASAITRTASAAGAMEAFWAKITAPDHLKGASEGWDKLTPSELDYIVENGGKLPPGVTIEQLRSRA